MPYIQANGLQFYYEDDDFTDPWDEPEVVLIQHGWGRSSRFFYHWVPGLVRNYRVLRRDMRGHGLSDDVTSELQVDDLVADILGFIDGLGVKKVHYVGESAGGVLGAAFAARYPERVRSLTLISAPLRDPTYGSERLGYSNLATAVSTTPMPEFVQMLIKGRGTIAISPAHERWMVAEWCKNRPENLAAYARLFPSLDLTDIVPGIRVPTLIIAPSNSSTAPLEEQKRMHELIPYSRIEIVNGRGHELFVDRFEDCFAAFQRLLASTKKPWLPKDPA